MSVAQSVTALPNSVALPRCESCIAKGVWLSLSIFSKPLGQSAGYASCIKVLQKFALRSRRWGVRAWSEAGSDGIKEDLHRHNPVILLLAWPPLTSSVIANANLRTLDLYKYFPVQAIFFFFFFIDPVTSFGARTLLEILRLVKHILQHGCYQRRHEAPLYARTQSLYKSTKLSYCDNDKHEIKGLLIFSVCFLCTLSRRVENMPLFTQLCRWVCRRPSHCWAEIKNNDGNSTSWTTSSCINLGASSASDPPPPDVT